MKGQVAGSGHFVGFYLLLLLFFFFFRCWWISFGSLASGVLGDSYDQPPSVILTVMSRYVIHCC